MVVTKARIANRAPSTVSLMPEGLLDALSHDEIANLLAFVSRAGAREVGRNRCTMRNPGVGGSHRHPSHQLPPNP